MKRRIRSTWTILISLAAFVISGAAPVLADNAYFAVAINTLEDSSDPNSAIVFTTVLEMSEADRDGDVVGWQIDSAFFTQTISGEAKRHWKTDAVSVDTPDGLWWVEHGDPDAPVPAEFDLPPLLSGEAAVHDSSAPEPLVYLLKGQTGTHNYNFLRYDYSFRLLSEEDPEEEDEDDVGEIEEPVVLPPISVESNSDAATAATQVVRSSLAGETAERTVHNCVSCGNDDGTFLRRWLGKLAN